MENNLIELENKVRQGLENSYKKLLEFKRQKNTPLIFTRDGKIIEMKLNTTANNGYKK
jgi:hypothetical protein